jgi:hypothetical protein
MTSNIDTNVSNYTLSELMAIVEIDDLIPEHIVENTNYYIRKYKNKNPALSVFFKEVQSQLLQYSQDLDEDDIDEKDEEEYSEGKITVEPSSNKNGSKGGKEGFGNMSDEAIYPAGEKQISDWYQNEVLTQKDTNQVDKITNRKQKIQVFGSEQVPMNREQIATTDTYNLPVKQDTLNPNLKNTISRFVNLDSQFRQYTSGVDSMSTDYTLDLSDTLKDVLKLSLYSYQIPFSWYTIDIAYGNTCLWISHTNTVTGENITVPVSVPVGNYSQNGFISQLNESFKIAGFTFPAITKPLVLPVDTPVYYNSNNGLVTLFLNGGSYTGSQGTFTITPETTFIIFYDFTAVLQCGVSCYSRSNHYFNNSLGWAMGYRLPYLAVDPSGNTGGAIMDLNGPKYLILAIDDYNQNHINNTLVSISQYSNTLKMPVYYSPDLPYTCVSPAQRGNNLNQLVTEVVNQSLFDNQTPNAKNGLLIAGKYEGDYSPTQTVLPSAPRTLTNAQLYTINSINNNNNNLTNYLAKPPTTSDILAILPVKTSVGVPTGTLLVEFSGSLQDSERTYFGPVNIERMAVKLLDDKGNILNLNGNDWCVTLVAECLYQY